ncbi:MAG: nucleoside diphosphate kinase regulator [Desulfatiglans sp.]|jgi:regulator of nucleoside diphosphate kinase|nr:nucleoside diphosphate kinase regulator [Desulfatiglans sp.]
MENKIYITEKDIERLEPVLDAALQKNSQQRENIERLLDDLDRADIVDDIDVPDDVVIMNSEVTVIDLDSKQQMTFALVFPENADLDDKKISILAPVGSAVLGYRVGDIVEWRVPLCKKRLKIDSVIQRPETLNGKKKKK